MLLKKTLIGTLIFGLLASTSTPTFAQEAVAPAGDAGAAAAPIMGRPDPPMKNVFHNVLWGSMAGGLVYMSLTILDDSKTTEERYSFKQLTIQFITGATYGGLAGLGTGVYLSLLGVSFDANRSRIAHGFKHAPGLEAEPMTIMTADQIPLMQYDYKF
ncbi:MAG: hypothetical protein QNL04_09035 [SAR324 cluster bacterium]|nr:hypothetical protein [SAR324 cluster bacterium]